MNLRAWLRRSPQPELVRIVNENDEEQDIKLSAEAHGRWSACEQAVLASRAVSVQCLDGKGAVIRALVLQGEGGAAGDGDDPLDPEAREERYAKKLVGNERRELAAVLDRYGDRLNEAFERGADAASGSQQQLVDLVTILTTHLASAITSLHNVSRTFAAAITGDDKEAGGGSDEMLKQVLGMAAARMMSSPAAPPPNGKGK
jgi:hypothetical protein